MFYDVRVEPKKDMSWEEIRKIITKAFEEHGGLSAEGVEFLGKD